MHVIRATQQLNINVQQVCAFCASKLDAPIDHYKAIWREMLILQSVKIAGICLSQQVVFRLIWLTECAAIM